VGITTYQPVASLSKVAETLAEELAATAIVAGNRCTWLTGAVDTSTGERRVVYHTGAPSLYEGDAGIAWVLAHAARAFDRNDYGDLARAGALCAVQQAERELSGGLYSGACGVSTAALQVAVAVGDARLQALAIALLEKSTAARPPEYDLISGTAGIVLALLAAHAETGAARLLDQALELGRELAASARRRPWGWAWPSGGANEPGLCGLAHGASGIAWALAELDAVTGSGEFEPAIGEALRYERSWFDRRRSNWPDLRSDMPTVGPGRPFAAAWCHGAAGIGLTRLRLHTLGSEKPILLAEASAALQATFADARNALHDGRLHTHGITVCHGLGGAVDLLLTAHLVLGEAEHLATARLLLGKATAALGSDPSCWPDGLGNNGSSLGMMTGAAGTLLVFLRAANVLEVPSVGLFPRL
jgi:lantibiotic modifying enzyme